MKAAENIPLERTVGDTDPFLLRVTIRTDQNPEGEAVSDDATVTMRLGLSPVVELEGTARGDSQGYFSFDTSPIEAETRVQIAYQLKAVLSDGTTKETLVKGSIVNKPTI